MLYWANSAGDKENWALIQGTKFDWHDYVHCKKSTCASLISDRLYTHTYYKKKPQKFTVQLLWLLKFWDNILQIQYSKKSHVSINNPSQTSHIWQKYLSE